MKKHLLSLMLCIMALSSGCAMSPLARSYTPLPPVTGKPSKATLVVLRPEEGRPLGNQSRVAIGFFALVPGMPFGPAQELSPEHVFRNNNIRGDEGEQLYSFRTDLGQAVARDLRRSALTADVTYVEKLEDCKISGPKYFLKLKLKRGMWHRHGICYGLSFFAGPLWLVASLPNTAGSIRLTVEAQLTDAQGRLLGQKEMSAECVAIETMYYPAFFARLPVAYGRLSPQLRQFVAQALPADVAAAATR